MGSLSDYLENALLSHIANVAFTAPAAIYVALATADPTDAGTGASMSEVASANAYTRAVVTFGAAAGRAVGQNAVVTFPQATGPWGTITHWGLVDSATPGAGNLLAHGAFTSSVVPVLGTTVTIPSGQIQVTLAASAGGAGFPTALVHAWLNLAFRNQAFAKPATYIGLATTVLSDTTATVGDLSEVSGNNYSRAAVNINGAGAPTWTLASGGALSNAHDVTFPTPSGSWGLVVSAFLVDSSSGAGNILGYDSGNLVDQVPVAADTVLFPVGGFTLTLT